MGAQRSDVAVGQIRRIDALGSSSRYRVVALDGPLVAAEVVDAPGLPSGMVVRLTADAVAAMDVVDIAASRSGPIADAA